MRKKNYGIQVVKWSKFRIVARTMKSCHATIDVKYGRNEKNKLYSRLQASLSLSFLFSLFSVEFLCCCCAFVPNHSIHTSWMESTDHKLNTSHTLKDEIFWSNTPTKRETQRMNAHRSYSVSFSCGWVQSNQIEWVIIKRTHIYNKSFAGANQFKYGQSRTDPHIHFGRSWNLCYKNVGSPTSLFLH